MVKAKLPNKKFYTEEELEEAVKKGILRKGKYSDGSVGYMYNEEKDAKN